MSLFTPASRVVGLLLLGSFINQNAQALELDWHGQFRAEENLIFGYTHNVPVPTGANPSLGYSIPNNGDAPATFQNLFFRLDPRVIVNDNVSLHSDLWLGTPDQGFFGSNAPTAIGSYQPYNTGNANVTAHTLYGEVASDFGTIRVGRLPLNWGLGLVWNSDDKGWDRLPSNGDGFGLVTKFGAFKFMPTIVKYQDYNHNPNFAPATGVAGEPATGNAGESDYTVALSYDNDDEQVNLGVLFMRRIAGMNANVLNPYSVGTFGTPGNYNQSNTGYAYNLWDFYAKKKAGVFSFAAEVPLVSGLVASHTYSSVSGALKVTAKTSEHWNLTADLGSAAGQDTSSVSGLNGTNLTAFYFHPDYRPGFLMFNYNYRNIALQSGSPYDNPITDARFVALRADYSTGKWTHGFQGLWAVADKVADGVAGNAYFNTLDHQYQTERGGAAQDKGLGVEVDYSLGYDWDESIHFGLELGLYAPGSFYDFNNTSTPDSHKTIFGTNLSMMVKF